MVGSPQCADQGDAGFAGTAEEVQAIWEAAAERWQSVRRRPTAGDVALYRRLSGTRLERDVLILGVTPEIRDLVADGGARPVLLDTSGAMYEATTRLLRRADPSNETWIRRDWCDVDPTYGSFDLVLGDMIWWCLPAARQRHLRDAIHTALKPGGEFVGRFHFSDPTRAQADPSEAVEAILGRLTGSADNEAEVESELLYWLYDHTADHVGHRLDRARTRDLLLEFATVRRFSRHAAFLRGAATRLVGADWTVQTRDELLEILNVRFDVVAEDHATDYDASLCPVLALRPR